MLIGGTAVALHGYYRHSIGITGELTEKPDIDLWYNPTYKNYFSLLNVIDALGQDVKKYREEQSPNPRKSFFRFDFDEFSLDLLPEIKAKIKFLDANTRKETVEFENIKIHFISYPDLIEDKKASGRDKDLETVLKLK